MNCLAIELAQKNVNGNGKMNSCVKFLTSWNIIIVYKLTIILAALMEFGTIKYRGALEQSCTHVESAKRFDFEGLHQLKCTKCM